MPPECVCDTLWNGAGCTVDMRLCHLQGAIKPHRDSVVGACFLTALDKAAIGGACGDTGSETAFTVTDVLAPHHGWKVCSLLNAHLETFDAEDSKQASHCAGVAPASGPGNDTSTPNTIPGPGCTWKASVQHVFGHETSVGMPVRCRGYGCTPAGTFSGAKWAELVPFFGVPTLFDARMACRGAQSASTDRASLATTRDVNEVQARQLRGLRGSFGVQHSVLWYLDETADALAWRTHVFLWVGSHDGEEGAWQEQVSPVLLGRPASQYLQPDPADPDTVPHYHSVVCVVTAPYTPGVPRAPSTSLENGGATTLLWLDPQL
jgi:hypothetical protein